MSLSIPNFANARVLVVGDVMLDRYWSGPTSRISPEAPVPVVKVSDIEDRAGGAGNVALNIASLGSQASLLGLVGQDNNARALESTLQHPQIHTQFSALESHPTITKLRVLSRHQQLIRLDFEEDFNQVDTSDMLAKFESQLADCDVVVLSDYGKGALNNIKPFIAAGRAAGKAVLIDPKGSDFARYTGATLITPNLGEFEAVMGVCKDEADLVETAKKLMKECAIPVATDVACAKAFDENAEAEIKHVSEVQDDDMIFDLGPDSTAALAEIIGNAKTILWNGPVGVFEFKNFEAGTAGISKAIADSEGFSVAGGGDTLAAIDKFGIKADVSYISTGGGAFLEFVEGKVLPAVAMLEERAKA